MQCQVQNRIFLPGGLVGTGGGPPPPPAAPVATAATAITFQSFSANWNASATATSYRLDVSTVNTFVSFVPGYQDLNVGNVLTASVVGLNSLTQYFYRVRAVNAGGTSGNSNTISVITALETQVANWQTRAVANGGAPSVNTLSSMNTFWRTLRLNALDTRIFLLNVFAPDDAGSMLTPLVVGGGHDPWLQIDSDLIQGTINDRGSLINGVLGDTTGHWETGFMMDAHGSRTNYGATIYVVEDNGATFAGTLSDPPVNNTWKFVGNNPNGIGWHFPDTQVTAPNDIGFTGWTVTPNGVVNAFGTLYLGNSGSAFGQVSQINFALGVMDRPSAPFDVWVFDANQDGSSDNPTASLFSFFALHEAFNLGDFTIFYNAVTQLRTDFGGGFV